MNAARGVFLPTARPHNTGVDIHLGGEHEARAFLIALQIAIEALLVRGDRR